MASGPAQPEEAYEHPKVMLTCPHCAHRMAYRFTSAFPRLDVGRFTCTSCHREFFVLGNEAFTPEQYLAVVRLQDKRAS